MSSTTPICFLRVENPHHEIQDYQRGMPRWCPGCGDNAILASVQRLCRDEQLPPEKTVCVSGIGCSSRLPHYMNSYGVHGIHGRAFPIAQGIKVNRPDLAVFVTTGDGDCCSIGTAHWIHALRYNTDLTVLLHDNRIYGLTKKQASPTSRLGLRTNTTPRGALLEPLNPLTVSLGVTNVSFVAQVVDWIPDLLHDLVRLAYHHKGFALIRILQRCPHFMDDEFEPWVRNPDRVLVLEHPDGITLDPGLGKIYRNRQKHDLHDIHAARKIASSTDPIPVGLLYCNSDVPSYEALRRPAVPNSASAVARLLDQEFDKFTIWPAEHE